MPAGNALYLRLKSRNHGSDLVTYDALHSTRLAPVRVGGVVLLGPEPLYGRQVRGEHTVNPEGDPRSAIEISRDHYTRARFGFEEIGHCSDLKQLSSIRAVSKHLAVRTMALDYPLRFPQIAGQPKRIFGVAREDNRLDA